MKQPSLTILIIDDDNNFILLLKDALEEVNTQYNLTIITANHIGEISEPELKKVNLGIIDLFMPQADGITTSLIIRSKHKIPILILTSNPEDKRLSKFERLLEPILPIEKSPNYVGTSNTIYNYYKFAKDFIGLQNKVNEQDVNACALGYIMNQCDCEEEPAKEIMIKIARNSRSKVHDIAKKIISRKIRNDELCPCSQ